MTSAQRLVSAFIVFHLAAITIGAIPSPDALPDDVLEPRSKEFDGLHGVVTRSLDALVAPLVRVHAAIWTTIRPLRPPFWYYLRATRQYEKWNMFYRPPREDEYMHMRYYVRPAGSRLLRVHRELVYPAHEEGTIRLFGAFSDSFRDKALSLGFDGYLERLEALRDRGGAAEPEAAASRELFPILDFFTRRFESRALVPGERIEKTELWWGLAPTPAPGEPVDRAGLAERHRVLQGYDAFGSTLLSADEQVPVGASMREADIVWRLLAVRTWP